MATLTRFLLVGFALLLPFPALGQFIAPIRECPLDGVMGLPCQYADGLRGFLISEVFVGLRIAFVGIALAMAFYYAVRLLIQKQDENLITETKDAYEQAIIAAGLASLSSLLVDAFAPGQGMLINAAPLATGLDNIKTYVESIVSFCVTALMTIQGFRLIAIESANEAELEKQKTKFFHSLLGVAIIVVVDNAIVERVFGGGGGTNALAVEIAGIGNYLLEVLGGLVVISFIAAGFMLILSVNETLKERAKKTMFGSTIALIVVLCSYMLVNLVIL